MFNKLTLNSWRQYGKIDLDLSSRLTVLTGSNGAGKTTILNLLNRHFDWNVKMVGTNRKERKVSKQLTDFLSRILGESSQESKGLYHVGEIRYASGKTAQLNVPANAGQNYIVEFSDKEQCLGLHIPSHRPIFTYTQVESIPTTHQGAKAIFDVYSGQTKQKALSEGRTKAANYYLKESLIALATFGYGNVAVAPIQEAREIFEGFQNILIKILPRQLGFRALKVELPDVVLETNTGTFSIDSVSGGVSAVIDIAWQIYVYSVTTEVAEFTVTIDEPEAHLHPEMQRTLLSDLLDAFPRAHFIVTSHSPFIVTSVASSKVYALRHAEDGKVVSHLLDLIDRSGSATRILQEVLGMETTAPIWAEVKMKEIIDRYSRSGINKETYESFKTEMSGLGFDSYLPEKLAKLADNDKKR